MASTCIGNCISLCNGNCTGTCSETCADDCTGICRNRCGTDCTGHCTADCTDLCIGGCSGTCNDSCSDTCIGGCLGGCLSSCTGTCKTTCSTDCTGTAQGVVSGPIKAQGTFITSFQGTAFKFDIGYEYSNEEFKLTSVKTTALQSGWGVWELQPSLYLYALKGINPVPKAYQSYDANGTTCKQFVTDNSGVWQLAYNGNNPGAYLPNTAGTTVAWNSSDFDQIVLPLSGSSATITIGAFIANTTGTLNNAAYGFSTLSLSLYAPSTGYALSVTEVTAKTITATHYWTQGSVAGDNYKERSITVQSIDGTYKETVNVTSGTSATFTVLKPNTEYVVMGVADDGTNKLTASVNKITSTSQPTGVTVIPTENNLTLQAESANNTTNLAYKYIITKPDNSTETKTATYDKTVTFSSLNSNTNYNIQVFAYNTSSINTSPAKIITAWTKPQILPNGFTLSLTKGLEHTKINAVAVAENISKFDQYCFKINNDPYSEYSSLNTISYTGITENTNCQITVMVKNTDSGLISNPISKSITTWYNPLTNLSVILKRKWFWYLEIGSAYTYNGTITKFEFSIGNESYQNKGTTNLYSKGSTVGGNDINLNYNTDYECKTRLTDNHGRTYETSTIIKTLDERPLYLNGVLREVKLIKDDGSIVYVTPNLISIIQENGTVTNMNKIINNDLRDHF